ncbi:MAG: tetratricopeptide repeat protein [Endomicrobium sp.]|jgi:tetratricopeptide (TPR) repeat protein|nr:tetratricopeptide repeat protein [Endomicrobium sp.]
MKDDGKIQKNDKTEHMELGKFYFLNNKCDEAISEFKKVIEIDAGSAEAYYNIGLTKETCGDFCGAKEMYSKALSLDQNYKSAREKLNKLIGLEDE